MCTSEEGAQRSVAPFPTNVGSPRAEGRAAGLGGESFGGRGGERDGHIRCVV